MNQDKNTYFWKESKSGILENKIWHQAFKKIKLVEGLEEKVEEIFQKM